MKNKHTHFLFFLEMLLSHWLAAVKWSQEERSSNFLQAQDHRFFILVCLITDSVPVQRPFSCLHIHVNCCTSVVLGSELRNSEILWSHLEQGLRKETALK